MPTTTNVRDKARQVASALYRSFWNNGGLRFGAEGDPKFVAAAAQPAPAWVAELGYSGLAVQSVGYEEGAENPRVHVYVTKGSAGAFKKLANEVDGVRIQVDKIGNLTVRPEMASGTTGQGKLFIRKGRVACGSSCAPVRENYSGTLGALVRKTGQQRIHLLSNNHVLAACNHIEVGRPIMSPSNADGRSGMPAPVEIGRHREIVELRSGEPVLVPPCKADIAIADVPDHSTVSSWQGDDTDGYDTPTAVVAPAAGMQVKKFGRTTGYTTGVIEALLFDPMPLPYKMPKFSATVWFQNVWTVRNPADQFALQGDSGSLVVTADGKAAVGIVFAASPNGEYAVIIPMDHVVQVMNGLTLVSKHGV